MRSSRVALVLGCLGVIGCGGTAASVDGGSVETPSDAGPTDAGLVLVTTPALPAPTGECPDFSSSGRITVSPAGIAPRAVELWISDAADTLDGPVIFYWHGTGSRPEEAVYGLGQDTVDAVLALGGMIIAPTRDPAAGQFPWFLTVGTQEDDLLVADEALACAAQQVGVDPMRIHSVGMSAGGLQTSQMSFRRASYLASVVAYSGGLLAPRRPPTDEPSARFGALLFHGGSSDVVIVSFQEAAENYRDVATRRGYFNVVCDHGNGHRIPLDARPSVWRFLQDHPFGASYPSSYASGLPEGFPEYCAVSQ
jgi:predicted esterase